uniref:Uncharacterized protein n=1 Tax=Timema cristinae TaxID=61476 RepID=A0A7R9CSY0_TIMCR|nr:unnamed protein product [Timema cristinae]
MAFNMVFKRGVRVACRFGKTTLSTSDLYSSLDSPVVGSIVYCKSDVLDHTATESPYAQPRALVQLLREGGVATLEDGAVTPEDGVAALKDWGGYPGECGGYPGGWGGYPGRCGGYSGGWGGYPGRCGGYSGGWGGYPGRWGGYLGGWGGYPGRWGSYYGTSCGCGCNGQWGSYGGGYGIPSASSTASGYVVNHAGLRGTSSGVLSRGPQRGRAGRSRLVMVKGKQDIIPCTFLSERGVGLSQISENIECFEIWECPAIL